jgi:hypothetical protein
MAMIFEAEELKELATAPGDRAAAALGRGDLDAGRAIAAESVDAHFSTRDIYTSWNAMMLGYIEKEFGAAAAHECLDPSLRTIIRPIAEWFRNGVSREAVLQLAQIFRMDAGTLAAVEEDEETITFVVPGWFAARGDALAGLGIDYRDGEPLPAPDLRDVARVIEQLCVEWLGYPPFVFSEGTGEDPLRLVIHKNPLAVPEAEFERLGVARDEPRIGAAFDTSGALLFDPDEREQMRFQAYTLAVDAIDAGDVELAKRHLMLSKIEWYPGHHLGRDFVTALCSWILDNHGVEHVWESVEVGYNRPVMGTVLGQVEQMPLRDQVEWLATLFHQHAMRYELIETEGGIEFHTVPCGSGGRLIDEGAYGPPKNFGTIEGPRVESFGLEEMPAYCLHCPATNKLVLSDPDAPPFLLVEPDLVDGRIRGHCSFHIFKDRGSIPAGMFDRVGVIRDEVLAEAGAAQPS